MIVMHYRSSKSVTFTFELQKFMINYVQVNQSYVEHFSKSMNMHTWALDHQFRWTTLPSGELSVIKLAKQKYQQKVSNNLMSPPPPPKNLELLNLLLYCIYFLHNSYFGGATCEVLNYLTCMVLNIKNKIKRQSKEHQNKHNQQREMSMKDDVFLAQAKSFKLCLTFSDIINF